MCTQNLIAAASGDCDEKGLLLFSPTVCSGKFRTDAVCGLQRRLFVNSRILSCVSDYALVFELAVGFIKHL
jgi:hypothetical protein